MGLIQLLVEIVAADGINEGAAYTSQVLAVVKDDFPEDYEVN
jgi:hypothetical protein